MNWDAAGAIGEIVGAVAVVASLIYLANQIRHGTNVAMSDALERSTENWRAAQSPLLDQNLADLYIRGCASYLNLNLVERKQFDVLLSNMLYEFELVLEKQKRGLVDRELVAAYESGMHQLFEEPGVMEYWESHQSFHHAALHRWLEKNVR